jgi:hypothetical protein
MAEVKISSAHLILNPAAWQNRLNKRESRTHWDGLERGGANS